jgi:exopolysaccharide production protein ExoY
LHHLACSHASVTGEQWSGRQAPRYRGWRLVVKRAVDLGTTSILLVLTSPIMAAAAAAIVMTAGRPVLFRQQRVGRHGRRFVILKLRTMRPDAQDVLAADPALYERYLTGGFKLDLDDDPRLLRVGRFLRRYSIDEIPQLLNVLRGDMSLVGPRPVVPGELPEYGPLVPAYLHAWPGITGAWQVAGRDDIKYPERAELDAQYLERWSLLSDPAILLRTLPSALRARGVR